MVTKASAQYIKITPRKVRAVIDLIRGKRLDVALNLLANLQKRPSVPVKKLLDSAFNNVRHGDREVTPDQLMISGIEASPGPVTKRHRAGAMGRAMPVVKRTSHIQVTLQKRQTGSLKK